MSSNLNLQAIIAKWIKSESGLSLIGRSLSEGKKNQDYSFWWFGNYLIIDVSLESVFVRRHKHTEHQGVVFKDTRNWVELSPSDPDFFAELRARIVSVVNEIVGDKVLK